MTKRRKTIGGNWKMNLNRKDSIALAEKLVGETDMQSLDLCIYPALPYLDTVAGVLAEAGSSIKLGAQNFHGKSNGSFTGEISLEMLRDIDCQTVLVGHSERRHKLGESDVLVNQKLRAALDTGFDTTLCIGETLKQREADQTNAVNTAQLCYGLAGVTSDQLRQVTLAYEPVWAIGTGESATPEDAASAHAAIRRYMEFAYGKAAAAAIRIQYGGSVKPDNAAEFFAQTDIDGALVGGASLEAEDFLRIIQLAKSAEEH
ncbi:triose-phosphate isomerase [Halomonas sp. ZH2S]|uniref:Triosephosphate isomerase n=1 Tax=Vreelandella zhuhanensis TaxID=2684210 RepID=A0A7X3KR30_9GAMM|nr:triose-phosphate isomerase [Halomonas zhuhanensis]MWJ29130.1 triose-phosphate isomerase [Halomonas zhuhanensis]